VRRSYCMGVDKQVGTPPLKEDDIDDALLPVVYGVRRLPREQADPPEGEAAPTPLGLQAATELEANKWAKLWAEGSEYNVPNFDLRGESTLDLSSRGCYVLPAAPSRWKHG